MALGQEGPPHLAKVLYARKKELEDVLKTHLEDRDELVLAGVRYRMFNTAQLSYPFDATLGILTTATGLPRDELVARLAAIDKKSLDALIKEIGKNAGGARVRLLKAELETVADKANFPRFWAKAVAG